MIDTGPVERDIVLVGGGHAHVEVLRRFAMEPQPGTRLTLIARDVNTPYSGMLPGYIAGHYGFEECHIDLGRLCRMLGARLFHAEAIGVDLRDRVVCCRGRPPVSFDLLSLDIGSVPSIAHIEGARRYAIPIKPVDGMLARWEAAERRFLESRGPFRVVVVGGGAGGVEVSLSLHHRLTRSARARRHPARELQVSVVADTATILPGHEEPVRRRMRRALEERGIAAHVGRRVTRIDEREVACEPEFRLPWDAVVVATHASAPAWLGETGLALDDNGFIRVGESLQSVSDERVFAVGDVASFDPRPLPKNGVYAVRAGPVLAHNLRAVAGARRPRAFRPQARTLALISTGNKHAVASYGKWALEGGWVWNFKDRIDRRWMRRYQSPVGMDPDRGEMRCGGCGAKVPSQVLDNVLRELRRRDPPGILVGLEAPDDAAVVTLPPGSVAVQSVDQFRSFIDDPYLFGRIATNHCLNDIYSMGAKPSTAMAIVTLPYSAASKMEADLRQVLTGALEGLDEAGVALVGGHTAESSELAFGLSVTGFSDPNLIVRKSGLRTGDALILTKPIGTGVILAADMRGAAKRGWLEETVRCMLLSNALAMEILREHGVSGCTDVTGFGLLGHLGEMLRASRCHADLYAQAVPVLGGAQTLIDKGIASTLQPANAAQAAESVDGAAAIAAILCDPQTAGGLLAGIPAERAEACLGALRRSRYATADIIGRVTPGTPGKVTLLAARGAG